MRIERLELQAFGRFDNRTLDLQPGLNVIYGPNEAGKSTVQRFIEGMLYGQHQPGLKRRVKRPEWERYRPWHGRAYRGALSYRLSDGRGFRIERDFEEAAVRIFDADTGQDLTGQFHVDPGSRERLFAAAHLGLSQTEFLSTVCIGQLLTTAVSDAGELAERIANLQDTGREDASATQALGRLERAEKEQVGSDRAPTSPWGKLMVRIARLQGELEAARQTRAANLGREAERNRLQAERDQLAAAERRLSAALDRARLAELQSDLQRAEALQAERAALAAQAQELAAYAAFPADAWDEVNRLAAAGTRLDEQTSAAAQELERLNAAVAAAAAKVEAYDPRLADLDEGAAHTVSAAFSRYQQAVATAEQRAGQLAEAEQAAADLRAELAELRPDGTADDAAADGPAADGAAAQTAAVHLSRLEELEEEIAELRRTTDLGKADLLKSRLADAQQASAAALLRWQLGAGAALVAGVALGLIVRVELFALALLALPLALAVWRQRAAARQRLAELQQDLAAAEADLSEREERLQAAAGERRQLLAMYAAGSAADLRLRLGRVRELELRLESAVTTSARLSGELQAARDEAAAQAEVLRPLLGLSAAAEPDVVAVDAFRRDLQGYRQAAAELAAAQREQEGAARRHAALQTDCTETKRVVEQHLAAAGVETVAAFAEGCRRHRRLQEISARRSAVDSQLAALLQGEEVAALQRRAAELAERAAAAAGVADAADPGDGAPADAEALERELGELRPRLEDLRGQVREMEATIRTHYERLPDLAALERELAAAAAERDRLAEHRAALTLARETIAAALEAMHREFAPRLAAAVGEISRRLTGGRYRQVRIDSELAVTALSPEDGALRPAAAFSHGTLDQLYFALRIAMARLLTAGKEPPPLVLDDSFVQYDDDRAAACLAFLADLGREHQIILATCHRRELEAVQALDLPAHVIDLGRQG